MHVLQHVAVNGHAIMVYVTALSGGVSTAIYPDGDATAMLIHHHQEAASLPAIIMGPRLRDPEGPSASVTKLNIHKRWQRCSVNGCFHQVTTVLQTHLARASHGDGRSEKGDVD